MRLKSVWSHSRKRGPLAIAATAFLAALVATGTASATDTGKGGPGPGSSSGGAGSSAAGGGGEGTGTGVEAGDRYNQNPDLANAVGTAYKPWEVGAIFTTHRLIFQGDQQVQGSIDGEPTSCGCLGGVTPSNPGGSSPGPGQGVFKQVNDYEFYARYDLTKNDRIGVKAYVYEYFLADQGENGVRFDDMVFSYSHSFNLPKKFRLQTALWVTAPTSYTSQLEGVITTFIPRLELDRRFGPVSIDARVYDTIFVERYDTWAGSGGATPTNLNSFAMALDAELHMPFHEPLSVGLAAFNEYVWYYNPQSEGQSGNSTKGNGGGVESAGSQPAQQVYGFEAYTRYLMPDLFGFKSDLTFAYSFGDPVVGYSSVLQDGVGHVYLGYLHNSELYLSLAVRY